MKIVDTLKTLDSSWSRESILIKIKKGLSPEEIVNEYFFDNLDEIENLAKFFAFKNKELLHQIEKLSTCEALLLNKINNDNSKIFCTHCGVTNAASNYGCDRCGEKLIKQPDVDKTSLSKIICEKCQNYDYVNSFYCWSCGCEITSKNPIVNNETLIDDSSQNLDEINLKETQINKPISQRNEANSQEIKNLTCQKRSRVGIGQHF